MKCARAPAKNDRLNPTTILRLLKRSTTARSRPSTSRTSRKSTNLTWKSVRRLRPKLGGATSGPPASGAAGGAAAVVAQEVRPNHPPAKRPKPKPTSPKTPRSTLTQGKQRSAKNVRPATNTLANARETVVKPIAPTKGPRRRRRRGGRRGASRRSEAKSGDEHRAEPIEGDHFLTADDEMAEVQRPDHEEAHYDDRRSRHEAEDEQEDGDDDELREGKAAPSIPTWKEVIGLIIAGNMESRPLAQELRRRLLSRSRRTWPRPRFRRPSEGIIDVGRLSRAVLQITASCEIA